MRSAFSFKYAAYGQYAGHGRLQTIMVFTIFVRADLFVQTADLYRQKRELYMCPDAST